MDYSPTVRARRLIREIVRLRTDSGLSMEVAASRLDWSKSKLYRIEAGHTRISTDDLEDMLDLYGVRSPQREALIQLGRDARKRGWWTAYSDVFTGSYIGMEAVITHTRPALTAEDTTRTVAARTARQQALFGRDEPPQIHVVLDEAALRREVGGPETIREQLAVLAGVTARPYVTIQVLAFSAGAHAGMDGKFTILTFPDPEDPPIAYVEGLMGDVYLETDEDVDLCNFSWSYLVTQALPPGESAAMIRKLAKDNR
jgi:hypothetical protein